MVEERMLCRSNVSCRTCVAGVILNKDNTAIMTGTDGLIMEGY
jgi:hypothetical protein